MTVQREIDPVTGENVIVKYGPDGEPQAWYPDPGWLGAENELAGRKLAGYGGTMASVFTGEERDLERSAHWARKEPYFEALRQAYPNAAAVGEIVQSEGIGRKEEWREHLSVHRKADEPCPRCGTPIKGQTRGGSETNYCVQCQPLFA